MKETKEIKPFVFFSERKDDYLNKEPLVKKEENKKETLLRVEETKKGQTIAFTPTSFFEVETLASELLLGATILLNVAKVVDEKDIFRILDFLSGIVYVYKGKLEQIGDYDFTVSIFNES